MLLKYSQRQEGLKLMKCDYLENAVTVQLKGATFLMQNFLLLKWKWYFFLLSLHTTCQGKFTSTSPDYRLS